MSTELFHHETEREAIAILADTSALSVDRARMLLEQHPLEPGEFHLPAHGEIFTAATQLLRESRPVDLVSMSAALKGNARVPAKLLNQVLVGVPGTEVAFPGHVKTIRELALKRRALSQLQELQAELARPGSDIEAVLAKGAGSWAGLTTGRKGYRRGDQVLLELIDQLEATQRGEDTRCVPTGIDTWDQVFGGVDCGKLTFIGSQPGVGKSSLLATFLDNWSQRGVKVGVFSLEDLGTWVPRRMLAKAAGIPNFVLAKKKLTDGQLQRIWDTAADVSQRGQNYFIDDRSLLTASQLCQTARDMIINQGCRVILVDHLGKLDVEANKFHRHDLAIEHALQHLTALAKEYGVPVVLAAHLKNDDGKTDARYRRPNMQDFALSAWIYRDARIAAGLYLSREEPDVVMVAALKQTDGDSDQDFPIRKLKGAAMLSSVNGRLEGTDYEQEELEMQKQREGNHVE